MHPRTLTQVNTAYFPCLPRPNHTHTLTLIRIQNKQAAGTKTSKHFTESTKKKKKSTVYNSEKHHPSDTQRDKQVWKPTGNSWSFLFLEDCPVLLSLFQMGKYFSCLTVKKSTLKWFHLTLAALDSSLGESGKTHFHNTLYAISKLTLVEVPGPIQTEV